jgi:spore coat protein U-like protein
MNRNVKPVQKIELSKENMGRRIIFAALFLLIGVIALGYGFSHLLGSSEGWEEISVSASAELNCGDDFTFRYDLGAGETSATAERKALTVVYTDIMESAFQMFSAEETFEDVVNIAYINQHPNEILEVEEPLYRAFELLKSYGNRIIYLAPVYEEYENLFYCNDEVETVSYDPYRNEELAERFAQIAGYARDETAVDVELLGDGKIRLKVSQEYLDYAAENVISDFVDFNWMKNAFVIDYAAEELTSRGYTNGMLTSYDGFSRNLGVEGETISYNLYDREADGIIYQAGTIEYSGSRSFVYLRSYPLDAQDVGHYFEMSDGSIRTIYVDPADGKCRTGAQQMVVYADGEGCASLLLRLIPFYIADDFSEQELFGLETEGVYAVLCEDYEIRYNDRELTITGVHESFR